LSYIVCLFSFILLFYNVLAGLSFCRLLVQS